MKHKDYCVAELNTKQLRTEKKMQMTKGMISDMITKLGDGMRHLGEQASKMGEVADASVATKGYSDSLVKASNRVDELSSTYEEVSEGLTGLVKASAEGASTGAGKFHHFSLEPVALAATIAGVH